MFSTSSSIVYRAETRLDNTANKDPMIIEQVKDEDLGETKKDFKELAEDINSDSPPYMNDKKTYYEVEFWSGQPTYMLFSTVSVMVICN